MNLEKSINSLTKKLNRFDPTVASSSNTSLGIWKGRPIIPLEEWIEIRNTPYALKYFPDDFDRVLTCISEDQMGVELEHAKKWESDYLELMESKKNPNYGKLKCFYCLLSPAGDDPIFIGINRLVSKGLIDGEQYAPEYPCQVVNRFQCPYERTNIKEDRDIEAPTPNFDVDDLFRLHKMAFIVEIALAKARKGDSEIQIKDKQDLFDAFTDRDTLTNILQQAADTLKSTEYLTEIYREQEIKNIVDYFLRIINKVNLDELTFY